MAGRDDHRHQNVDIAQLRDDRGFVADNDLVPFRQPGPHRLGQAGGERSGKGDPGHGLFPLRCPGGIGNSVSDTMNDSARRVCGQLIPLRKHPGKNIRRIPVENSRDNT